MHEFLKSRVDDDIDPSDWMVYNYLGIYPPFALVRWDWLPSQLSWANPSRRAGQGLLGLARHSTKEANCCAIHLLCSAGEFKRSQPTVATI